MKKNHLEKLLIVTLLILPLSSVAQTELKVMFYNLLRYPDEDAVANREDDLEFILSDYQPDLFLTCELTSEDGANTILGITKTAISNDYVMANYVENTSDNNSGNENELQNQLYYNSTKFSLIEQLEVPTNLRDFNVYKLQLNTINKADDPVEFLVVVCHLKASSGPNNELIRFQMVQELDNYLSTLPADTNVILGGDLNLYTAFESAFQELLDGSNNIVFADPPNRVGNWNNNPNYIDVFTQSTRRSSDLGGAGGGFDDRFDFILVSENMMGSSNINYQTNSYQVYGNNNERDCWNRDINSSDCAGDLYSFAVRDALYNFSDHLPVTVTLETDAQLLSIESVTQTSSFKILNSLVSDQLKVLNSSTEILEETFTIYNILGQSVITQIPLNIGENSIDVSALNNGIYFFSLNSNPTITKRFVITN